MKGLLALVVVAGLLIVVGIEFIQAVQPEAPAPKQKHKTEHELRPDIDHCFEFDGEAFVDCVTRRA